MLRNKGVKWFLFPLFFILFGVIGTNFFEKESNWFINLFTIQGKDIDTLTNTIWSVQAVIVSLSIALLAMVIGPSREVKFGINILEFYFVKNRKMYTLYEVLICLLLLIFFNYFIVAKNLLFFSLLNLTLSLFGIFDILSTIFKILKIDEVSKKEIQIFILKECKDAIEKENIEKEKIESA